MRYLILMGSPRKNGNTIQTTLPIVRYLEKQGHEAEILWLYDLDLRPCIACRVCQKDWAGFGCHYRDDMQMVFDKILACDCLVLATPIYGWYCTPPMKSAIDRLIYGMNKFYGETRGPSLWKGKPLALIITSGYPPEKGADLFEQGMMRYSKHCCINYVGSLALHDLGYKHTFMTEEKMARISEYAVWLEEAVRGACKS